MNGSTTTARQPSFGEAGSKSTNEFIESMKSVFSDLRTTRVVQPQLARTAYRHGSQILAHADEYAQGLNCQRSQRLIESARKRLLNTYTQHFAK